MHDLIYLCTLLNQFKNVVFFDCSVFLQSGANMEDMDDSSNSDVDDNDKDDDSMTQASNPSQNDSEVPDTKKRASSDTKKKCENGLANMQHNLLQPHLQHEICNTICT